MAKVKTLREDVYRKIAAGEVVERPLSVVKELVENSIDAGADSIKIDLLEGGKRQIKITDNGCGFEPEDIETAFKRHSTSKITELEDFDSLFTLGFRGEALPSVLEVSKIEVTTSDNNDGVGQLCIFEDGKLAHREDVGCSRGSTIVIKDLFYNFPVRKKFLKTDRTELNRILAFLEPLTLVHYSISFELTNNGRTVFIYKKAENLGERIYQVFGKEFLDNLTEVEYQENGYGLKGYISRINTGVSVKKHQYFFVNGRAVREKTLIASFNNIFDQYLEKHRNPVGILALSIPPQDIDVNIHPMKLEVKFVDTGRIYRFVRHAVQSAFSGQDSFGVPTGPVVPPFPRKELGGGYSIQQIPGSSDPGGSSGGYDSYRGPSSSGDSDSSREPGYQSQGSGFSSPGSSLSGAREVQRPLNDFDQTQLFAGDFLNKEDFILIGQYKNSYIIIERNGELLIVDQHNAHERANFDKLKKQFQESGIESMSPLFPLIVELSPSEAAGFNDEKKEIFEKMGFRLESLSGNSFDVKAFPQVLGEKSVKDAVMEIIHMQDDQIAFEDKVLAQVACKSAIKVNHKLYPEQMNQIVRDLFNSSNPYFCPHKRPIIIEFSLEQIEKMLKRK